MDTLERVGACSLEVWLLMFSIISVLFSGVAGRSPDTAPPPSDPGSGTESVGGGPIEELSIKSVFKPSRFRWLTAFLSSLFFVGGGVFSVDF